MAIFDGPVKRNFSGGRHMIFGRYFHAHTCESIHMFEAFINIGLDVIVEEDQQIISDLKN